MKKLKYVIIGIGILVALGVVVYLAKGSSSVEVEVYTVKTDNITSFIDEIASVKANNQRIVYSKAVGEVLKLDVSAGKSIKKGDIIAVLNTEEAELQIKSLQAKKNALYATYNEAIKLPAQEIIDNAEANVRSKEILVESAKSDAEKAEKLFNEGAISKDNYQDTLDNLELQQEALKVAENELANIKKGPSENIKKQYEAQLSELDYQIAILNENKGNAFVKAPIDGVVLETYVKEGSYLQPGAPVIEIGNDENLYLESDILVSEVGDIKEGAKVIVYSDDLEIEDIAGEVTKIHPKAFSKVSDLGIEQKRVKIEIDLNNNIDVLKVGYEVNAKIVTDEKKDSIVVPDSAIFDFEDGDYAYVVDGNNAVLRKVETGIGGEDMIEITSGLNEGDKVILSPDENVREGVEVKY
ncbi:efflux RND transporter periplasmic adaptor subunit [Schnuerera sp. xch1]|uniref:efflux RND transporter periplasmic adaptor subunit n=1 Tax=Schnuerera sp. xch1 TaxID=2874283 RepID=UPI001CBBCC96|nr:efflux RND transporter periplasmic adaptor subunit [Schnuerera sp. xch1]MBZ2174448.1 efflux RND transporter periplasmic adaptor subunit [Schnuerera sp. xch1]